MEILRITPFPLSISYDGLQPSTDYALCILDDHAQDLFEIPVESNSNGVVATQLPDYFSKYDAQYLVEIYEQLGTNEDGSAVRGDLVLVDNLSIMRPYVNPADLADSPEDIEEAAAYEALARALINSITGGFLYERQTIETVGLGNDYLALPFRLNKVIQVIENDLIVFDAEDPSKSVTPNRTYYITPDKGAISIVMPTFPDGYNRMQSKPVVPQLPASDSFTLYNTNDSPNIIQNVTGSPMFPNNWDYVVTVEAGWPVIPKDIEQATKLLVNDMKCNNIPYVNAYITEYKSDQFTLKFDKEVFRDTGNRIVDRILSAYVRPIYRLGVI